MGTEARTATHPKPSGKTVEFYLGRNVRGATVDLAGTPILTVGINGYNYELKMGEKNKAPIEVYEQLMNSRSRTIVPDMERAERAPHQEGQGYTKVETLCDYEVALLTKEDH